MKNKYTSTKLACYAGYIVQAVINNFLPILFIVLQDIYGLGYEKLARLIVFNFATQIATDLITPKIVGKLGYKKTAILCQGVAALGLVMMGILPRVMPNTYLAIVLSIIVYAFGSGLMEVIMSPIIEMLPTSNKAGNMAFLHSFYCWGQVFTVIVTTALVALVGFKGWYNVPLIWAVIPFINMFSFIKVPIVEPNGEEKKSPFKALIKSRRFRIYMVMMLCAGASEIAMAQWASIFAQRALGVSKVIGDIAGPCAFAVCMGIGRVWYGIMAEKISFKKTLVVLSALCVACYLIVAFCEIEAISLVFCALCGFTVSISWPGVYSFGAQDFPNGASVMFSVFAMCGDLGCSVGPWVLGAVADKLGLNTGFAVSSVFPALMIVCVALLAKNKGCKTMV